MDNQKIEAMLRETRDNSVDQIKIIEYKLDFYCHKETIKYSLN